jgi:hypothetical protein
MKTSFASSFLAILILAALSFAQPQQSENFKIAKSVIDAGGAASSSENFKLYSAFGQPTPIGLQSSTDFVLSAGYLSPMFQLSPLSPIQNLVIKYNNPNINLNWGRIAGAASYVIYRDTTALFTPGPTNQIGTASDTFYVDLNAMALPYPRYFYNVESSHASPPSLLSTSKDVPRENKLAMPNVKKETTLSNPLTKTNNKRR